MHPEILIHRFLHLRKMSGGPEAAGSMIRDGPHASWELAAVRTCRPGALRRTQSRGGVYERRSRDLIIAGTRNHGRSTTGAVTRRRALPVTPARKLGAQALLVDRHSPATQPERASPTHWSTLIPGVGMAMASGVL